MLSHLEAELHKQQVELKELKENLEAKKSTIEKSESLHMEEINRLRKDKDKFEDYKNITVDKLKQIQNLHEASQDNLKDKWDKLKNKNEKLKKDEDALKEERSSFENEQIIKRNKLDEERSAFEQEMKCQKDTLEKEKEDFEAWKKVEQNKLQDCRKGLQLQQDEVQLNQENLKNDNEKLNNAIIEYKKNNTNLTIYMNQLREAQAHIEDAQNDLNRKINEFDNERSKFYQDKQLEEDALKKKREDLETWKIDEENKLREKEKLIGNLIKIMDKFNKDQALLTDAENDFQRRINEFDKERNKFHQEIKLQEYILNKNNEDYRASKKAEEQELQKYRDYLECQQDNLNKEMEKLKQLTEKFQQQCIGHQKTTVKSTVEPLDLFDLVIMNTDEITNEITDQFSSVEPPQQKNPPSPLRELNIFSENSTVAIGNNDHGQTNVNRTNTLQDDENSNATNINIPNTSQLPTQLSTIHKVTKKFPPFLRRL